jgi:MFS family permease
MSSNGNGEWPAAPSWAYGPNSRPPKKQRSTPKLRMRKQRPDVEATAPTAPSAVAPPVAPPDMVPGPSVPAGLARAQASPASPTQGDGSSDSVPGPSVPPDIAPEPSLHSDPVAQRSLPDISELLEMPGVTGPDPAEATGSIAAPLDAVLEVDGPTRVEGPSLAGEDAALELAPAAGGSPPPNGAAPERAVALDPEGPAPGASSRLRLLTPLKLRDFRLLWTGMTVSLLGDGIFLVAIAWQVYQLSNAPTALSVVGVAMSIPHVVLLLLGGVVSDRFDRRKVMVGADVVRGLAIGLLGFLSVTGALELWHVMVLTAFYGAGTAFFGPAFDAIVPDVVPPALLAEANSLDQFVRPAAWRLAGPALGGFLIAIWGAGGAFLLDAATFAVSIVCVLMMRPATDLPTEEELEGSAINQVKQGFSFVRAHVWLWGTFLAATFAYLLFMGPTEVLLPFVIKNRLGGSASDLGFVFACGGVGAILAAVLMGQRGTPRKHITFIYIVWTLSTPAVAGYGLAHFTWEVMAACFAFNALETAGTIVWATTKQRLVPSRLLGRVSSFDWFISIGLLPVSFALTAPVAALIGAKATLVGAGVVGGVVTFCFLFLPGMRAVERSGAVFREEGPDAAETAAEVVGVGPEGHGLDIVGAPAPTP